MLLCYKEFLHCFVVFMPTLYALEILLHQFLQQMLDFVSTWYSDGISYIKHIITMPYYQEVRINQGEKKKPKTTKRGVYIKNKEVRHS